MQNNKKRIIYFSTYDDIKNPYYGGGGAIAVHEVAKQLSKHFEIHVLSWDYSGKKKEIIDGVHYERFGNPSLTPRIAMFVYQMALPFVARKKQFDLWCESFCPPFTTAFLPFFIKKPVIGIVHMLAAEDMERKYKLPFHFIQNAGLKRYKYIIATSNMLQKKVEKINPLAKITVISNGIPQVFKPSNQKQKYILFLGRIEVDQKGIDLLLDAFKQFHKNYADYKLIIAGMGTSQEIEKMKNNIISASLTKEVILKGRVEGKEKEKLLKNAACLVVPSRFETFSITALEAMAYGAPLVCFSIDGLSWIPENAVVKAPAFNSKTLAKGITNIIADKRLAFTLKKEGYAYAKKHTWDIIARRYKERLSAMLVK